MMNTTLTIKQQLVDDRLAAIKGVGLALYLAEGRAAGDSWDTITRMIWDVTNVPVTAPTAQRWHAELNPTP